MRHKPKIDLCCKVFLGEAKQFDSEIKYKFLLRKCLLLIKQVKTDQDEVCIWPEKNGRTISQKILWSHLNRETITAKNENCKLALSQCTIKKAHKFIYFKIKVFFLNIFCYLDQHSPVDI